MSEPRLRLEWIPGTFAVCRLDADQPTPEWACDAGGDLVSITRTDRELSIIVRDDAVPPEAKAERRWIALRLAGTLDFGQVGILARLARALADATVPMLAVSTFDTDVLLVKARDAGRAVRALREVADCSELGRPGG